MTISKLAKARLLLGLLTAGGGICASVSPPLAEFATGADLYWLFQLRGPRAPPEEVVIITMDDESSARLGQPGEPSQWDRQLHARLVSRLAARGARVVVFDVFFECPLDSDRDSQFADAIKEAGNVLLLELLYPNKAVVDDSVCPRQLENVVGPFTVLRSSPLDLFYNASAAAAPFPLPKEKSVRVNQTWLFKGDAGDVATLPVIGFHLYTRPFHKRFNALLTDVLAGEVVDETSVIRDTIMVQQLRELFRANPRLSDQLYARIKREQLQDPHTARVLRSLAEMYGGHNSRYTDFYGPAYTVKTVPYYKALESASDAKIEFKDKAVFVGASKLQADQQDEFKSVFSTSEQIDLSGVEIAATVFANLLEGRHVRQAGKPVQGVILLLWGIFVAGLYAILLRGEQLRSVIASACAISGLLLLLVFFASSYVFTRYAIQLPVVVPSLVQLPIALIAVLVWKEHLYEQKYRSIREALGHMVPKEVAGRVVDEEGLAVEDQTLYGVCMATDAQNFTVLAERLGPEALMKHLHDYYKPLFEAVERHGGFILDIAGDGMMAIWTTAWDDESATRCSLREQVCSTALEISRNILEFNRIHPDTGLPTRIGLHCGRVSLGNVGTVNRPVIKAVGDTVNIASRIENLNKQLGTYVLTSQHFVEDLDSFSFRPMGSFSLKGRSGALDVYELVGEPEKVIDDSSGMQTHPHLEAL